MGQALWSLPETSFYEVGNIISQLLLKLLASFDLCFYFADRITFRTLQFNGVMKILSGKPWIFLNYYQLLIPLPCCCSTLLVPWACIYTTRLHAPTTTKTIKWCCQLEAKKTCFSYTHPSLPSYRQSVLENSAWYCFSQRCWNISGPCCSKPVALLHTA